MFLILSASQIAVGQEDGQLGFECTHENLFSKYILRINMEEEWALTWDWISESWNNKPLITRYNYVGIEKGSRLETTSF